MYGLENGKTSQAQSTQIHNFQIDNLMLPPMETIFMPIDPLNKLSGPDIDGLLGQEFLKHFQVAINFKKKEVYLWYKDEAEQGPWVKERH